MTDAVTGMLRSITLIAVVATTGACADPAASGKRVATSIEVLQGNEQVGIAGQELPLQLVVRILDAAGDPVDGAFILWTGDGSPWVDVTDTSDGGITRNYWTLGDQTGPQELELWSYDLEGSRRTTRIGTVTATARLP